MKKVSAAFDGLKFSKGTLDYAVHSPKETFTHSQEEYPTQFIKDLLKDIQCPVILVPREYSEIKKVILLYDGTPSSVFAIKMFNYLMPWMGDVENYPYSSPIINSFIGY